ncbi:arsenate reductase/protein-tyrosine-phosphatase family protein [Demequina sediminicola]|uniref:arsenate reductase/protein-tyrosine-phosphatase family protein n=1 Tax=Demequina sediminicola TaxID=1095026 RepID=UPI000782300E|nr:low molecular weight phosphatase family protein [Demequina sediminicola]
MAFKILTVCTGNICRSPAAAMLLRSYLGEAALVASAGLQAVPGGTIPAEMLAHLDAAGWDGRAHTAFQINEGAIKEADLVVTMTVQQRTDVLRLVPAAMKRTVVLDELRQAADARLPLAGEVLEERLRSVTSAVAVWRATPHAPIRDVADPYRGSIDAYDAAFKQIDGSCRDFAAWVRD